ncbi:transcriptional regulator, y4mF family [compost metagenome]|nr:helix-turn-helix domain-containing protein [Hydrogenophaga sp.]
MQHLLLSALQLGQLLKSARKRMHLNQQELGARVGLSQARISMMEREPHTIAVDQLLTLMGVLKLELVVQDRLTPDLTVTPKSDEAATSGEPSQDAEW